MSGSAEESKEAKEEPLSMTHYCSGGCGAKWVEGSNDVTAQAPGFNHGLTDHVWVPLGPSGQTDDSALASNLQDELEVTTTLIREPGDNSKDLHDYYENTVFPSLNPDMNWSGFDECLKCVSFQLGDIPDYGTTMLVDGENEKKDEPPKKCQKTSPGTPQRKLVQNVVVTIKKELLRYDNARLTLRGTLAHEIAHALRLVLFLQGKAKANTPSKYAPSKHVKEQYMDETTQGEIGLHLQESLFDGILGWTADEGSFVHKFKDGQWFTSGPTPEQLRKLGVGLIKCKSGNFKVLGVEPGKCGRHPKTR